MRIESILPTITDEEYEGVSRGKYDAVSTAYEYMLQAQHEAKQGIGRELGTALFEMRRKVIVMRFVKEINRCALFDCLSSFHLIRAIG